MDRVKFVERLMSLLEAEMHDEIIGALAEFVKASENDAADLHFVACLYAQSHQYEDAVKCFLKAISLEPMEMKYQVDFFNLISQKIDPAGRDKFYKIWTHCIGSDDPFLFEDQFLDRIDSALQKAKGQLCSLMSRMHYEMNNKERAFDLFFKLTKEVSEDDFDTLDKYDADEYLGFDYDLMGEHHQTVKQFTPFFLDVMKEIKCDAILDVACGTGLAADLLRPYASRLVGVDLSEKMVGVSKETGKYDEVIFADMCDMSNCNETFDVIFCLGATYYLESIEAFLIAAAKRLRPGGYILFSDYISPEGADISVTTVGNQRYCRSKGYMRSVFDRLCLTEIRDSTCLIFGYPSGCWAAQLNRRLD